MAFCANCGAAVEGSFCGKCGSPVAGPAGTRASAQPASSSPAMADNVASALCYVLGLITGIVFLVIPPYNQNRTVRFHAFQSIFLHIAAIVIVVAGDAVLTFVHLWMFTRLLTLAFFLLWVFMIFQAWQGKKIVLPVVGQLAEQQA
jgi:uncharacterized membrane protein